MDNYNDTRDLRECYTCAECIHFCRRGVYEDGDLTGISYSCSYDSPFTPEPDGASAVCQHFHVR